jgi:hypothetical protein
MLKNKFNKIIIYKKMYSITILTLNIQKKLLFSYYDVTIKS